jgi:cytochrome b561
MAAGEPPPFMDEYGPGARAPRGPARYDTVSMALHWLIAGLVVVLAPLGLKLSGLPFPSRVYDDYHMWHRSLGEIAFVAILALVWWRARRPAVAPIVDAPWRLALALWVKWGMTLLLILTPLTKLVRGAFGLGWAFFGLTLAAPWPANPTASRFLTTAHEYCAYALLALAGLHTAAALWRALVVRDAVFARMWPGGR